MVGRRHFNPARLDPPVRTARLILNGTNNFLRHIDNDPSFGVSLDLGESHGETVAFKFTIQGRITDDAQRGAVDHSGVTFHEGAERFIRVALDMLPQQFKIIAHAFDWIWPAARKK